MISPELARRHLAGFRGKHVVVLGDVMLDEYVKGDVSRISPEAPVPVVDLKERGVSPGGAANAAANIVSLGGTATLIGLAGDDAPGASLRQALRGQGIQDDALVALAGRPTTHKLRIVARTQQIVRVDVESRAPLTPAEEAQVIAVVERLAPSASAFVVSDYAKGLVTRGVAQAVVAAGKARGVPVVVDPKDKDFGRYAGATVITPNLNELEVAAGEVTANADAAIAAAARRLLGALGGAKLLVTRGAAGMTLVDADAAPMHLPTVARSVFDVTGAGDTVVGTLVLALAAGVPMRDALVLATHAASIAVGKAGTVAVTAEELLASFAPAPPESP